MSIGGKAYMYGLMNGEIIPVTGRDTQFSSMIVDEDKIIAIGGVELLKHYELESIIDLKGKTVVPGFYDSHLHLVSTFMNEVAINFDDATSFEEVYDMIRSFPNKKDYPIIFGKRLSEFSLKEKRLPTRKELDEVVKDFPLIINSIEFHTILVNSAAMNLLKIPFTSEGFEKDEQGLFTGRIRNRGAFIALKKAYALLGETSHLKGADKVINSAVRKGVTTLVTVEGGPLFHDKHPEMILKHSQDFDIDVTLFYSTTDIKKVIQLNLPRIGGDIFVDGSFRSHNAAMFEPYKDNPDNLGKLFFSYSELYDFVTHAHDLELQISLHAVGPRAIELVLDVYEEVLKNKPKKDHRYRIEHFELPLPRHIKRAKELGIVLAMHPTYEYFFREEGMMYHTRLNDEMRKSTNPFKSIVDEGIVVAGCSDSDSMPIDPMLGIHSAVNHSNKASQVDPYEALKMFTINGAYGVFEDHLKGTLETGKIADFCVLDNNPLMADAKNLREIKVLATYKNGKCIYKDHCYD